MYVIHYLLQQDFIGKEKLIEQMFLDRADQFKHRLGWDVHLDENGWEIDQYDGPLALYGIVENGKGEHIASARFMNCRGDIMTSEFFSHLLPDDWDQLLHQSVETTRLCISRQRSRKDTMYGGSLIMAGGLACCLKYNISNIIGIFDETCIPLYKHMGWAPRIRVQKKDLIFGEWHVSHTNYQDLTERLPPLKVNITTAAHNKLKEWTAHYGNNTFAPQLSTY